MKIAVDRNTYKVADNDDYIYLFDKESLKDLEKTKLKCYYYKNVDYVDINLTDYDIECFKKASIKDKDFNKLEKENYKYVIIIPNYNNDHGDYNGKTYLRNSIESVLKQTYKDFELIIVDDCSDDTSVKTIKSYKDDRIHLIQNKRKRRNGGSRNVGIDYAFDNLKFDYFCFLDSDDWWIDENVLEKINSRLFDHDMLVMGAEMLFENENTFKTFNEYKDYKEFFISEGKNGKIWCTAWCRVIKKDKIAYFCEDTMMEDRVWSYKVADNVDFNKVCNLKEICYVWNRLNTTNSVSIVRNEYWDASAWCHIGHQLQMLKDLKHQEMKPTIEDRIKKCINDCKKGIYQQN
jgi:glycosyltransferase involved in cell wall biosynthesis